MQLTYDITPEDLLDFNLWFQRTSAVGRNQYRRMQIMLGVIWLTPAVAMGLLTGIAEVWVTSLFCAVLLAVFVTPWLIQRGLVRTLKRHLADPSVQATYGPHRCEVDARGLKSSSPIREMQVPWSSVNQIVRDGQHIYVCFPPAAAFVFSRDSYRGPVAFDQLPAEFQRIRSGK